jgi:enamine deaminase RidA (YjgF/YER057c/UK114 family)
MSADAKAQSLGLDLATAAAPLANYVASVRTGNLLVVSGQLPFSAGTLAPRHKGKLGRDVTPEAGSEAARQAATNALAQAKAALGSLDRIRRVVRLGGYINAAPGFTALAPIMNGASDLMVEVFGDDGRHARMTVGVSELPLDAVIEVEAMFEVDA